MGYDHIVEDKEEVFSLPQRGLDPSSNILLVYTIGMMLPVTLIWTLCNKLISAVLADVSLNPDYRFILELPDECAVLHNVPAKEMRAHGVYVPYENLILQFKIHHGYVVDREKRGCA